MRTYEIALPLVDNAGKTCEGKRLAFENVAMAKAGGYTCLSPAQGAWRDPSDGKIYYDAMQAYRLVCESFIMEELITAAFLLFDDQAAILVTEIGESRILSRNERECDGHL